MAGVRLGVVLVLLLVVGLATAVVLVVGEMEPAGPDTPVAARGEDERIVSDALLPTADDAPGPAVPAALEPRVEIGIDPGAAPVRPELPRTLRGRVVDEQTGEGVRQAIVLYRVADETEARREGSVHRADDQGRFDGLPLPGPEFLATASAEVWATAPGYGVARVRPEDGELYLPLRPAEPVPPPGSIAGVVVDARNRPFAGRVLVNLTDEFQRTHAQFALADAAGRFELHGVPAGAWRAALGDSAARHWLAVPSDGVVDLQVRVDDGTSAAGPVQLPLESRELVVRGFTETVGDGAVVVVRSRAQWMFRSRVQAEEASFPRVPVGRWTLEVREAGRTLAERRIEVTAGTDALVVDLSEEDR